MVVRRDPYDRSAPLKIDSRAWGCDRYQESARSTGDYNAGRLKARWLLINSAALLEQITGIEDMRTCTLARRLGIPRLQRPVDSAVLPSDAVGVTAKPAQGARQDAVDRIEVAVVKQLAKGTDQQMMAGLGDKHVKLQIRLGLVQGRHALPRRTEVALAHPLVFPTQKRQFLVTGPLRRIPGRFAFQNCPRLQHLQLEIDVITPPLQRQLQMLLKQVAAAAAPPLARLNGAGRPETRQGLTHGAARSPVLLHQRSLRGDRLPRHPIALQQQALKFILQIHGHIPGGSPFVGKTSWQYSIHALGLITYLDRYDCHSTRIAT